MTENTDEQAIRDRRIAAIRDEVVTYRFGPQSSREGQLIDQRVELLAEVDRLRGELAAVRDGAVPDLTGPWMWRCCDHCGCERDSRTGHDDICTHDCNLNETPTARGVS